MTVIIKTGGRTGRDRAGTVKNLVALANGNLRYIVSTTNGVQVPDELAFDYLNQFYAVPVAIPAEPVPVPTAEVAAVVEPVLLADIVAEAKASAPSAEATPTTEEPRPKKPRKPRSKPATTSDEGAE